MCGIIGFTGRRGCAGFLLEGLERLEYRGYDSAGVAFARPQGLVLEKAVGRIANLRTVVEKSREDAFAGIGHTRWATHGCPSIENAHPHCDAARTVAVVHNGIIENYGLLKEQLQRQGVRFVSETDTEVIAQLLGFYYDTDMPTTLRRVLPMLEGSYALGVLDARAPGTLYCARRRSPLLIGQGEGEMYIASDVAALVEHTRTVYPMEEDTIAALTPRGMQVCTLEGRAVCLAPMHITWDAAAARKGGYAHFMLKEICEQPQVLQDTLEHYADLARGCIRREAMPFTPEQARALSEVTIAACGTAYHAGMMGKALLEKLAGVRTTAEIASEYRYAPVCDGAPENAVFLAVSQSGETADTLAALRKAKAQGMRTIAMSNVIGASIAREAGTVVYTLAGPEIAVASTKAYLAQVLLFELIALDLAHLRGRLTDAQLKEALAELGRLPEQAAAILARREVVESFARRNRACHDVFFIGRLMDYTTSLEAALKLKEVSYLHSEAYAAGELKHGTIALIDEETLVVGIATQPEILEKTYANLQEVHARGAYLLLIGTPPRTLVAPDCEVWSMDGASWRTAPLLATIYAQLLAYYTALQHGCDIDKPRNLAKSVTVE